MSKMSAELTFRDKIEKFKGAYKTDIFESVKFQRFLYPLVISNCNGTGPWSFSDATIEYTKSRNRAIPIFIWYTDVFKDIAREMQGKTVFYGEKKRTLECLLDAVILGSDKHVKCLQSLKTKKQSEEVIRTILAIHYFQPLVYGSRYVLDRGSLVTCECCHEKIVYGDTTFGNRRVWHGMADIVIHESVVKVFIESSNDDDEDLACGEPYSKQRKEDADSTNANHTSSTVIEVETEKSKNKKAKSQALAQGIVNAFCEARRDKSFFSKFVPSFLATEEYIRVILYNCESDILLLSDIFPIWKITEGEITLNTKTLVHIWLFLNFEELDMHTEEFFLESTPQSKFNEVVGNVYPIYKEKVTRPLEPSDHTMGEKTEKEIMDLIYFEKVADASIDLFTEIGKL